MLNKEQKIKIVDELADRFKRQKMALFGDFHGVPVAKSQDLRRQLKKADAELKVAKKTLLNLALKKAGIEFDTKKLEGELAVIWGFGDEVMPAKIAYKFSRLNAAFKLLGGILGGKILNADEAVSLARLPSKEELLTKLVWTLQSPIRGLANVLQGNIKNLVVILSKIKDNKV
jgi:large subunit ribosomal protein L10